MHITFLGLANPRQRVVSKPDRAEPQADLLAAGASEKAFDCPSTPGIDLCAFVVRLTFRFREGRWHNSLARSIIESELGGNHRVLSDVR